MAYDRIYPGKLWLDTDGKPIQAHGFSIFYNKKDGLYYWYGENKEKTRGPLQQGLALGRSMDSCDRCGQWLFRERLDTAVIFYSRCLQWGPF